LGITRAKRHLLAGLKGERRIMPSSMSCVKNVCNRLLRTAREREVPASEEKKKE